MEMEQVGELQSLALALQESEVYNRLNGKYYPRCTVAADSFCVATSHTSHTAIPEHVDLKATQAELQ